MGSGGFFDFFLDLFFLVPLLLAVRAIAPNAQVFRIASILAGLYLLYAQAPRILPFFVVYWIAIWALQYFAVRAEKMSKGLFATLAVVVLVGLPLLPMLAWKISADQVLPWFNAVMARLLWTATPGIGFADALVGIVAPLGLSFATFRALDLLLKVYLGLLQPVSLDRALYYGLFPPILALGPISEYEEVRLDGPLTRFPKAGDVAVGLFRTLWGVVKIFAIGMVLERIAAWLWQGGAASVPATWAAMIIYGLYFYANFSGFSEVAIGVSRILGIKLKENFANPYLKTNPQAFWNAWHMSLTRWAQRYVFVPLGGMRPERQYVAIFAVIMVIALWHGLAVTMVVFGLIHAFVLIAHRWLAERRRRAGKAPPVDTLFTHALKSASIVLLLSLTFPLLILPPTDAVAFYGHLFLGLPVR